MTKVTPRGEMAAPLLPRKVNHVTVQTVTPLVLYAISVSDFAW